MATSPGPKRVAVIGAGGSGLCSVKTCLEAGLDVTCYELSDCLGGLWVYRESDDEGQPSVMRSTVINSSKEMSAFSDFPPPEHYPSFMHNRMLAEYLRMYAKHFGVEKRIRFRHKILQVTPAEDYVSTGRWKLLIKHLETGKEWTEVFEAVMICTGHHIYPVVPSMPGLDFFKGHKMHTHSLKTTKGMEEKEILIVGNGNSGVDAAAELSTVAKTVHLSTRRGFWLINRFAPGGEPLDAMTNRRIFSLLPYSVAGFLLEFVANLRVNHTRFNFRPKHRITSQHPTLNDHLPARILTGTVQIRGAIDHFTERGVKFVGDEKEQPLDVVILATGYSYKVPFISTEYARVDDSQCHLYKLVFPPNLSHPTLSFIGIIQPVGSILPISEMQARWFVEVLKGNCQLPPRDVMEQEIKARQDFNSTFFIKAPRHLTEVIYIDYMDSIAKEIGVKPNLRKLLFRDPQLSLYSFFGPCLPYQFRLEGPNPWPGARKAILEFRRKTQMPLNTRKIVESSTGSRIKEPLTLASVLLGMLFIPFWMYFLLIIM